MMLTDTAEPVGMTEPPEDAAAASSSEGAIGAYVAVDFDDGPETGLTALTSEDDLCDPRYWKFQEVHGFTPKFKVLFKDGFTSFLTTLPSTEDGVVVDEDGDEHRYVQIKELSEAKMKDPGDPTILRRAPGGYGFIEVVEDAFDEPEKLQRRSTKSAAKGGQSKRRKVGGVKAPDARVSPPAAEGPSDSLPEAGAVAEGVKALDAGVSLPKAAEGPVPESEGGASAKVNVEKAKTGRSVCRTCGGGIDKDSVRCGLQGYAGGRSVLLWAHANCFLGKVLVDCVSARRGRCKGTGEAFEIGQIRVGFEVGNHKSWWLPTEAARWTCEVLRLSGSVLTTLRGIEDLDESHRCALLELLKSGQGASNSELKSSKVPTKRKRTAPKKDTAPAPQEVPVTPAASAAPAEAAEPGPVASPEDSDAVIQMSW